MDKYRGWDITPDSNGYGYHGTGPDFDGPEDRRHAHGWTEEAVCHAIDDHLEDHPEDGEVL